MSFADAQSAYLKLQQRLAVAMGAPVLIDVRVDLPRGDSDELSFQKIVAWSYIVLFETGRISLNFLKELPPLSSFGKLAPHIRDLRTWISHNLALEKPGDRRTLGNALLWLKKTCGSTNPSAAEDWKKCSDALCNEMAIVLEQAILAAENLFSIEDGDKLRKQFEKRLSGHWDAYLFDAIVESSAKLLGYSGLDQIALRDRYLNAWRAVVESAEPSKRDELVRLRIEADLLGEMANALPWSAAQALTRAKLNSGAELASAMLLIRQAASHNRTDMVRILEQAFPEEGT